VSLNGTQQLCTVYAGANPYIDFNGSGQVTERYLTDPTGLDNFYARVSPSGTVNWYLTDNLGSIRQIVGTNGSVLDQLTYGTFGGLLSETNSANGDRFKYAGGEYDSVLGTDRFDARYYGPTDGRFKSQDPLSFSAGDPNLYRYVRNAPTDAIDPSGLAPVPPGSMPGVGSGGYQGNYIVDLPPSPPGTVKIGGVAVVVPPISHILPKPPPEGEYEGGLWVVNPDGSEYYMGPPAMGIAPSPRLLAWWALKWLARPLPYAGAVAQTIAQPDRLRALNAQLVRLAQEFAANPTNPAAVARIQAQMQAIVDEINTIQGLMSR
jgi:RHS repeat-associated protein